MTIRPQCSLILDESWRLSQYLWMFNVKENSLDRNKWLQYQCLYYTSPSGNKVKYTNAYKKVLLRRLSVSMIYKLDTRTNLLQTRNAIWEPAESEVLE